MGCVFCASGLDGVERNLTTGEIVEEMLQLNRLLAADERIAETREAARVMLAQGNGGRLIYTGAGTSGRIGVDSGAAMGAQR